MDKGGFTNFDCNFFLPVLVAGEKKPPLNICITTYIRQYSLYVYSSVYPPPPTHNLGWQKSSPSQPDYNIRNMFIILALPEKPAIAPPFPLLRGIVSANI